MIRYLISLLTTIWLLSACSTQKIDTGNTESTLFRVENQQVSKEEFLYSYLKNPPSYDTITVAEDVANYLELYKRFKLKVQAAYDARYDTIPQLLSEFNQYKRQLARPYLTETRLIEELKKELYNRMDRMVEVSHILISTPKDSGDTLQAYQEARAILDSIRNEQLTFETAATRYSDDVGADQSKGYIGYFGVFNLVAPFEDAAYAMEPGQISDLVKTSFGYHIIRLEDVVQVPYKMTMSHIFVREIASDTARGRKKIIEAYNALESGMSWDDVVTQFSEDPNSKARSGSLGRLAYNQIDGVFYVNAANARNMSYSKPFKTRFGWHITRVEDAEPLGSYEEMENIIDNRTRNRSQQTREEALALLKSKNQFAENQQNKKQALEYLSQQLSSEAGRLTLNAEMGDKILFSLTGQSYTFGDLITYLDRNYSSETQMGAVPAEELYDEFTENSLYDYEIYTIGRENPDFRFLLQEYREGIYLFEIMEDSIWNKASSDTLGLQEYFEDNRDKYQWKAHVEGLTVKVADSTLAGSIMQWLDNDQPDSVLNLAAKRYNILLDKGPFEKGDNVWIDRTFGRKGIFSYQEDDRKVIVYASGLLPPRNKELNEVRGKVIADYQKTLEEEWIKKLKQKYVVEINQTSLDSIIADLEQQRRDGKL